MRGQPVLVWENGPGELPLAWHLLSIRNSESVLLMYVDAFPILVIFSGGLVQTWVRGAVCSYITHNESLVVST